MLLIPRLRGNNDNYFTVFIKLNSPALLLNILCNYNILLFYFVDV